jgi:hypothetical protein
MNVTEAAEMVNGAIAVVVAFRVVAPQPGAAAEIAAASTSPIVRM